MNTMMIAMNAASCVVSARPRPVGRVLLADLTTTGQGTTVSVALRRTALAVTAAPFAGDISALDAPTYKTIDVARSHLGRPPV